MSTQFPEKTRRRIPETYRHIERDETESDHRDRIPPFAPLRPVAERKEVAHHQQAEVNVVENEIENANSRNIKRRVLERIRQDGL